MNCLLVSSRHTTGRRASFPMPASFRRFLASSFGRWATTVCSPAASFDVVTMWASIEHVPSPMATLRAIRSLLRPGARLLIACPCFDSLSAQWFGSAWYGLDLPRHLTHFTRASLRRHLEKAGFEVERVWSLRLPSFIRRSFAQLADDDEKAMWRWLARSRFFVGCLSLMGLLARRTDAVLCMARQV
ncbi:MAG TPA: class I SAM-dependent methyltransferase [Phycisphaerae bacterium]|nr:class I SAM-dependent methyltransferase [Phycisphaerae bacterium]